MESGVYQITNEVNGKRYIGSAVNFAHRWRQHKHQARRGKHNPIFQRSWNKYGEGAFTFSIIEIVENKEKLLIREQYYLDTEKPEYNCAKVAGSNLGIKFGPEFGKKISAANIRLWKNEEHRQKMSDAHKDYVFTDEHKKAISDSLVGKKLSESHKEIIRKNNIERNKSAEHRAIMSAYWKGRPKTKEQLAKMAETKRGVPLSESHRKNVSKALLLAYSEGRRKAERPIEMREKIGRSVGKFTDEEIIQIRKLRESGWGPKKIAQTIGASQGGISNICNRKTYKWVA